MAKSMRLGMRLAGARIQGKSWIGNNNEAAGEEKQRSQAAMIKRSEKVRLTEGGKTYGWRKKIW